MAKDNSERGLGPQQTTVNEQEETGNLRDGAEQFEMTVTCRQNETNIGSAGLMLCGTFIEIEALRELEENHIAYNFWSSAVDVHHPVDIMVPPHLTNDFQDFLDLQQLTSEVFIDNVQDRIDNEKPSVQSRAFGWNDYYRLADINAWMSSIATAYDVATLVQGGSSYEGRPIMGLRISYSASNINKTVFVEGGIHAREWISPAVSTFIIQQILTSSDPAVRRVAQSYDWYFFPVFNPDGYEYTHTTVSTKVFNYTKND
ncbi:Zinc carboxypeptidase [Popillia japonica]|uniref:Zinc carboxypeptidase n=1 Tax=Popillia japonica TaxID=7064 RepID=A0AAW1LS87_POPJA